ncbi:MAG: nucleotidyltransferase [Spirochaetaceae bacterium]|nr:MAG: nucleotidyltransferase [Spirochaetaceae bacterium]
MANWSTTQYTHSVEQDVRWKQRLQSYRLSLASLQEVYDRRQRRPLDRVELQALIKSFELCYETGWNLMKDWFVYQGVVGISGSRDAIRQAFSAELIVDGEGWMDMVRNRNRTAHTYNESVAREVETLIANRYYPLLQIFLQEMTRREAAE